MFYPGLGRNSNGNDFFFFWGRTGPIWLKMKPEWHFLFSFFTIFFGNAVAQVKRKWYSERIFFPSFSACLDPIWLEMKPKWRFIIFFEFIWECFSLGREETVPETIFFPLFWFVPTRFSQKWSQNDFFSYFILFLNFFGNAPIGVR